LFRTLPDPPFEAKNFIAFVRSLLLFPILGDVNFECALPVLLCGLISFPDFEGRPVNFRTLLLKTDKPTLSKSFPFFVLGGDEYPPLQATPPFVFRYCKVRLRQRWERTPILLYQFIFFKVVPTPRPLLPNLLLYLFCLRDVLPFCYGECLFFPPLVHPFHPSSGPLRSVSKLGREGPPFEG